MYHCEGDTLMKKNGLHGAYSKLEDRATNQAIIEEEGKKKNMVKALKGSYVMENWPGQEVRRSGCKCEIPVVGGEAGTSAELSKSRCLESSKWSWQVERSQSMESLISHAKDLALVLGSGWMM